MTPEQLLDLLDLVQKTKRETRTLEIRDAQAGCPRLYDALSSFSNQPDGGIILFGIDKSSDFREAGVENPKELQQEIIRQGLQMEPAVNPLVTAVEKNGLWFLSAEIVGLDVLEKPCFYRGAGRLKGSYVRVDFKNEPMTDLELYNLDAFRRHARDHVHDDASIIREAALDDLERNLLDLYLAKLKDRTPNLSRMSGERILRLMNIVRDGHPTLAGLLLFGQYPQAFLPELCILATFVAGTEIDECNSTGVRLIDSDRIEGTIEEMLGRAVAFVSRNMRNGIKIDPATGMRIDLPQYPLEAVREALLNALAHRDCGPLARHLPIRLQIFHDRLEITSPGGLFGRTTVDCLDTPAIEPRNPILIRTLDDLGVAENRHAGISTIRRIMENQGMPEPVFTDLRDRFKVVFYDKDHAPAGP